MVSALTEVTIDCPYCGAAFSTLLDASGGDSDYIEDCAVCCQPIEFTLRLDDSGEPELAVRRGDDTF